MISSTGFPRRTLLSLSPLHACSNLPQHGCTSDLVTSMYNHPSNRCRCCINNSLEHTCSRMWCSKTIKKVEFRAKKKVFCVLLRIKAYKIVHECYWFLLDFFGSFGSITAGKSACSFQWASPCESRVFFPLFRKKLLKIYFFQSLESFQLLYRPSYDQKR